MGKAAKDKLYPFERRSRPRKNYVEWHKLRFFRTKEARNSFLLKSNNMRKESLLKKKFQTLTVCHFGRESRPIKDYFIFSHFSRRFPGSFNTDYSFFRFHLPRFTLYFLTLLLKELHYPEFIFIFP